MIGAVGLEVAKSESVLENRIPASDVSCASFTKYVTPSVKEDSV